MRDFNEILACVAAGETIVPSELLPYLCSESREKRASVNRKLAETYAQVGTLEHLEQAKVFVRRAWLLSGFSADLLPLYIKIFSSLNDTETIREAYKRLGMQMASQGNITGAIRYFDLWQYAYAALNHVDRYEYDFDILESIDRLAMPHRQPVRINVKPLSGRKVHLAYLVKGITETGSVLLKISHMFAKLHDRLRFELTFFAPETKNVVLDSVMGKENLKLFRNAHCNVVLAPNSEKAEERLVGLARSISKANPDVLITSAVLANFEHCFVASLRPAPVVIGLIQGPPPQFATPALDWAIAWIKHPLMDCPVSCSLVDLEFALPRRDEITPYQRRVIHVPDDACILMSAGRHVKFQERAFWKAILDILGSYPQTYFFGVGVQEDQVPFLTPMIRAEIRSRIRFFNWRKEEDYLKVLCLGDILVDTFPSSGGVVLVDAMSLGIPIVSFKNDYMKLYNPVDWSLAEEIVDVPEILLPRGDFTQMNRLLSRLIEDRGYRDSIARRCQDHVSKTRGNPERAVRTCEDIYVKVLNAKLLESSSVSGSIGAIRDLPGSGVPKAKRWFGIYETASKQEKR